MKNFLYGAVAAVMASLFAVMFWAQIGGVATAFARTKPGGYVVTSRTYVPIPSLQSVY